MVLTRGAGQAWVGGAWKGGLGFGYDIYLNIFYFLGYEGAGPLLGLFLVKIKIFFF